MLTLNVVSLNEYACTLAMYLSICTDSERPERMTRFSIIFNYLFIFIKAQLSILLVTCSSIMNSSMK